VNDLQKARLAQNEHVCREVNEKVNEVAQAQGSDSHSFVLVCECSDIRCAERVLITLLEYEQIRAEPARFVVKKHHGIPEIEHVVETVPGHVVIEKPGEAGRIAIELQADSDGNASPDP
jgi:hypothetical protein